MAEALHDLSAVSITAAEPVARWSLRARDPAVLAGVIGHPLPERIGTTLGPVACLGPDEWLLRLPAGSTIPDGAGLAVSVVDISDRALGYLVEGPRALDLLQAGAPRDLARLGDGAAVRTVWEGVEIVLLRENERRFTVEVWRSFAPWLHLALVTAAGHLR